MRWIKFIYEQYLNDLEQKIEETDKVEVSKKNIENLREAQNLLKKQTQNISTEPQIGDVFLINSLYFSISDTDECPYEVFIVSPYWELASDKDLIADGKERRWVIENLVRYVEEEVLEKSIKVDELKKEDIKIMQDFVNEGKKLPDNRVGLSYIEGKGSYQELFKESERKRSLFLMPDLGYERDIEEEITINLSPYIKELESMLSRRLAAASFDSLIVSEYGDITKENKNLVVYFNEKYAGTLARVYAEDTQIFEGFLPKKLIFKSKLRHPQTLNEILKIEQL